MYLQIIPPDSLTQLGETITNSQASGIPPLVMEAFAISLIVLIIATIGKYLITRETTIVDWGAMLIELPIDICAIVSTIIASTQFDVDVNVTMLALSAVIPILLCSYFRRIGIKQYTNKNWWTMIACGFADVVIAFGWVIIIINLLF